LQLFLFVIACALITELIIRQSDLVTINQYLLDALGVGHASLSSVVTASAKFGFAAKLTGAGGGGCAFTVLPRSVGATAEGTQKRDQLIAEIRYVSVIVGMSGLLTFCNQESGV
jgi:mevalonate kinase